MKFYLSEIKKLQKIAGIIKEDSFSFQGKFKPVPDVAAFVDKFHIEPDSPLNHIVSTYVGGYYNFAITKEGDKYNVYKFRQSSQPGKSIASFGSEEEAQSFVKKNDSSF